MIVKKQELRLQIRQGLRHARQDSDKVCDTAKKWLEEHPELTTVALYAAMAEEVDLLPLLTWDPRRHWVFPRVSGNDLIFHEVRNEENDFLPGPFGIREPSPALPVVEIRAVDVFFCPGLAFDERGGRLGRGRGFYDRMLALARPDAVKIGVCFSIQRVTDTFPESHDVSMDKVIS